jgi:hypothetical protein
MLKKWGMTVLVVGISLLLSSCHIKQKPVETISRTTNNLRIYQAGDFIEYSVSATAGQGSLRVGWEAANDLIDPIDNSIISPVLKETTTLTYDGNTFPDATVIRYISQVQTGPDAGSIILHAVSDGSGLPSNPTLFWPYNPANVSDLTSPVIAPVVFASPMSVGTPPANSPLEFSIMEGCGTGTCSAEIYRFRDSLNVIGDSTEIPTSLGKFVDPFKISFVGTNTPANSPAVVLLGDIRHACGDSGDNLTHTGDMLVFPEIGIIQMTNLCQVIVGTGSNVEYSITISATNIPLP